jgi:hypothetical protein
MSKDLVSFEDLKISKLHNVTDEAIKHSAMAGSIFPRRADALKSLEIAKDNVKYVLGKLEMETHILGKIPVDGVPTIKITGAAMTAYVNSHPDVIQARAERAQAEQDYDNVKGIVTTYLGNKELLKLMMSDRYNEFYSSDVSVKAKDALGREIN